MRKLIRIVESGDRIATSTQQVNDKFRLWFGNSKVVDSDGSPLVVFHGSNAHAYVGGEINVFQTLPDSGRGAAFFSSSKELAGEYGEKLYSVYLRIENPLVVFGDGRSWTSLDHTTKIGGKVTDQLRAYHQKKALDSDKLWRQLTAMDGEDGLLSIGGKKFAPSKSQIPDDVGDLDRFNLSIISGVEQGSVATDDIVKQARKMGYDGVIFKEIIDSPTHERFYKNAPSDVFAVFRPNQIKSVSNSGEWDRDDPDVRA